MARQHRSHSVGFKRQVAEEFRAGETLHGLAKRHDLCRNLIRVWVADYEAGAFEDDAGAADLIQAYEARIAALERLVGKQALELEFLRAKDLTTGQIVQNLNPDEFFLPASSTKLFTVAAALDTFGADHRFVTTLHRTGPVGLQGELSGDLILLAVGDLTLGGRDDPDGTIAITNFDHVDANAIDGAELTAPDPLAGLDRLARQVADEGIVGVGDVVIDDRLFETAEPRPEVFVSPIIVNDNLIDLVITPAGPGQAAAIVDGQIAADKGPLVRVHPVSEPAPFARTLLIEALARAGVRVDAPTLGGNPVDRLPSQQTVAELPRVAVLESAPLSEYAKLILKVSHNLGAELMAALIAIANGERTVAEGVDRIGEILPHLGSRGGRFRVRFGFRAGWQPDDSARGGRLADASSRPRPLRGGVRRAPDPRRGRIAGARTAGQPGSRPGARQDRDRHLG
jgi:D-alanyl-D-alanine carboxypeptidase